MEYSFVSFREPLESFAIVSYIIMLYGIGVCCTSVAVFACITFWNKKGMPAAIKIPSISPSNIGGIPQVHAGIPHDSAEIIDFATARQRIVQHRKMHCFKKLDAATEIELHVLQGHSRDSFHFNNLTTRGEPYEDGPDAA